MPIERLGSSEPVIEVQVKSSLGTEVDAESKGVSLEGGQEGKEPEPKDNASTESESKGDRRPSMIPLPPPRLVNIKKPPNPSKKQPKRPAPIATDACPFLYSKFDTPTPTSTPSSVEEPRSTQPLAPYPIIEHPNRNTYPVHDRVPFAARAPGTVNSFPSPSYYSPNSSRYGAGIHPGSVTISPLIPFLPRTEEYRHFSLTPEKNVHIVQGDLPRPESFRDGLCLRLPPHLWDLVAGRQ